MSFNNIFSRRFLPLAMALGGLLAVILTLSGFSSVAGQSGDFRCGKDPVFDVDGNEYKTVEIGEQCWLAENLRTTRYADGTTIAKLKDHTEWWRDRDGSYALYDYTYPFRYPAREITSAEEMLEIYGYLYNYYAVTNPAGLCPKGWKIPSDEDWKELEITLGMDQKTANQRWYRGRSEGSRLSTRADLWDTGALTENSDFDASGFKARPAGYRRTYGDYGNISSNANFWTADSVGDTNAISREIYANTEVIYRIVNINKNNGLSVRCLQE